MVLETSKINGVSFCKSEKLFGLALNCPFSEVFLYNFNVKKNKFGKL